MFKSIIDLCQSLDNNKMFKKSDSIFNMLKKASTEDEGKTIEEMEDDLRASVARLDIKGEEIQIPPTVKKVEYTVDDFPKLQELRQQILDLIDQFRAAMDSEDEDFYKDVQNFQRYSDLKRLETEMGSSISADNRKREVKPIIEPRTDAEFDSWNRMNPEIINFSRQEERFHNICQRFEKDLSRQVPLIYDLNRIQTATSGMIIALDPKLIELGLKQGTLTYRGRMEGGEYFFLVDTDKGQRVYPIPTGVQFKPNAEGYFDLPFQVTKREDGTLKFQYR
jgi:hypothetical protein